MIFEFIRIRRLISTNWFSDLEISKRIYRIEIQLAITQYYDIRGDLRVVFNLSLIETALAWGYLFENPLNSIPNNVNLELAQEAR